MTLINTNTKIENLRREMEAKGVAAYIIPGSDPHQSEYVADHWKGREWVSGFTGSAGTVVVGLHQAGLWTDSRYFLQAAEELEGSGIQLMKQGQPGTPSVEGWLIRQLEAGQVVACDGHHFSTSHIRSLTETLAEAHLSLNDRLDLLEDIWENRPELPKGKVFALGVEYAGQSRIEKIQAVKEGMDGADGHLITTLDDIAWLLNIRGHDVECNPVAIAYAVVEQERVCLFIDCSKLDADLRSDLKDAGVQLMEYAEIKPFLQELPQDYTMLLNPATVNARLHDCIPRNSAIRQGATVSTTLKAVKNPTEMERIREVMAKDAVALLKLYRWLDAELDEREVSEYEVSERLAAFRKEGAGYYGESFHAIVGYRGNGAIVHYRPMSGKCAFLKKEGILLLDSGGQYLNGTTDITRTTTLGNPSQKQKEHFTLVLKGHIALALQKFPVGTSGVQLDTLARQYLWKQGLNFGHGTGHGVGFFLNVHEGPQGIGPGTQARYMEPFREGMFCSNEPGLYLPDEYGIRIENLVLVQPAGNVGFGDFLQFETVTLFPMDLELVDNTMLDYAEKRWLNEYHQMVWKRVSPLLEDEGDREWLRSRCRMI